MAVHSLTSENFTDTVELSTSTVIVDFWAEWCGPCKMVAPILDQMSEDYPDIMFAKVNVDEEPSLSGGITSIPTLRVYVGGEVVKTLVGAKPRPALEKDLAEYLNADV